MRAPISRKPAIYAPVLALALITLASCLDSSGPNWESIGVHQVKVWQLDLPESIASSDTLLVQLWGNTHPMGQLSLAGIDAVRESVAIGLTVWAEVEKWIGSGFMPPYCTSIKCDYQALPPFDAGQFRVVIHQPDGSQLVDSVLVEP